MPRKKPKNRSRIVIETPLTAPESRADYTRRKLGVVDPYSKTRKFQTMGMPSHPGLQKV